MKPIAISGIVFACVFGGALAGLLLQRLLPAHHRSKESQDVVKLGMAMVSSMAALVTGLLVASAKGAYDTRRSELVQMSANAIMLDRVLAHYGPEARASRDLLRGALAAFGHRIWPEEHFSPALLDPSVTASGEAFYDAVQRLSPRDASQTSLKSQALSLATNVAQTRWLLYEQRGSAITPAFLVVMVFWLALVVLSFAVYAPRNATVIASLFLSALAVSGALFLIMELDEPLSGLIRIPSTPVRRALDQLGR